MGTVHSNATTMKFLIVLALSAAAAQSTIKYKTAAFEPVDVATPADAIKIELKETENEQEILTPTIKYVANPAPVAVGYHGLGLGYAGLGYAGLGYGSGLPLAHAAATTAAEE